MNETTESLGTCCLCETDQGVRNILNVAKKSPTPGRGWGCMVCELPSDGAIAVLCDACVEQVKGGTEPKFACKGYPALDGRVPFSELQGEHKHDRVRHLRMESPGGLGEITEEDLVHLEATNFAVGLSGMQALAILATIQFATRHPVFQQAGYTYETAVDFGKFLQKEIATTANLQEITERGWNPQQDIIAKPASLIIIPGRG